MPIRVCRQLRDMNSQLHKKNETVPVWGVLVAVCANWGIGAKNRKLFFSTWETRSLGMRSVKFG